MRITLYINMQNQVTVKGIAIVLSALMLTACGEKKTESKDIIVEKPKTETVVAPTAVDQDYVQSRKVTWLDTEYTVEVDRHRDNSLPTVEDENGQKYNDNVVVVRVLREDGSEAFAHTFKKSDFAQAYHGYKYAEKGALLGVVLDKVEGEHLVFAASVGSPESSSDMFVPLTLVIDRMGNWSVRKASSVDTTGIEEDEV